MAINEANSLGKLTQVLLIEKDEFVYRSYLALGQYNILMTEIKDVDTTPLSLKSIKLLCKYIMCNNKTNTDTTAEKEEIMNLMNNYESEAGKNNCKVFFVVYATMLLYEDNNKDALRQVFNSNTLEQ